MAFLHLTLLIVAAISAQYLATYTRQQSRLQINAMVDGLKWFGYRVRNYFRSWKGKLAEPFISAENGNRPV